MSSPRPHRPAPRAIAALVGAALALALGSGFAGQWKWRDAGGQLHVSDLPPPNDIPDRSILQRPVVRTAAAASASSTALAAASAPAKSALEAEVDARRARAEQQQKADKAQREAQAASAASVRADNCQRARQHLAALESGRRMARINARGETEVIDDKIRAEESFRARGVIASDCR